MSLPTTPAILQTVLTGLAALFLAGAGGDIVAARLAAARMLDVYNPQTDDELRLAANIIGFSFQTLDTLGKSASPDIPVASALRLRNSAVSLSREATRAERRLAQLQNARQPVILAPPAEILNDPKVDEAVAAIQETRKVMQDAKANGISWSQAYANRQRDLGIAASRKRAEARTAHQSTETDLRPNPLQPNPVVPDNCPIAQAT